MSTKIYDGYRLRLGDKSWATFANEVRQVIVPAMAKELSETLCTAAIGVYHRRQLAEAGLLPEQPMMDRSAYSSVAMDMDDLFKETNQFSFVLFSDPEESEDRKNAWTYLITYGSNNWKSKFVEAFSQSHGLEEFGYWDNTDPVEGATAEEWEGRWTVWSRIGLKNKPPIECGVSVEMVASLWYSMQAMEPMFGKPERLKDTLVELTTKEDFLESCSKRLATDVDAHQYFTGKDVDVSSVIVSFLFDETRVPQRQELTRQINEVLTVPTWEDLVRRPGK